jgi:hypothetical protein
MPLDPPVTSAYFIDKLIVMALLQVEEQTAKVVFNSLNFHIFDGVLSKPGHKLS